MYIYVYNHSNIKLLNSQQTLQINIGASTGELTEAAVVAAARRTDPDYAAGHPGPMRPAPSTAAGTRRRPGEWEVYANIHIKIYISGQTLSENIKVR